MNHLLSESDQLIAVRRCEEAILRFTAHMDACEYGEMERYFAADGIWKRDGGDVCGTLQLREQMAAVKPGRLMRHVISNMRTTFHAPDHATVESYVTLYLHFYGDVDQAAPAPLTGAAAVGRYKDEMRRIDGEWKIQVRLPFQDFSATPA